MKPSDIPEFALLLIVAAGAFLFLSATFCHLVIRRLEIHERALRAFYGVYAEEDCIDRLTRQAQCARRATK
jgi:hypothetical protein